MALLPPPDAQTRQYRAERRAVNLARLRTIAFVAAAVHVVHFFIFQLTEDIAEAPHVASWRTGVMTEHAAMLLVDLLTALAAFGAPRFPRIARAATPFFVVSYASFGAVISATDQLVTSDASAWTLLVIGIVLVVQLDNRVMLATLVPGLVLYVLGQWLMMHDPAVLVSNVAKGFSVTVVAGLVSVLFEQHRRRAFDQRLVIERQRTELEAALAEARAAAELADRASRAKSTFLATMSHEIRTPMTGVLGVADLLAQTPLTPRQQELLHTITESGEAMVALISELLDMSKAEAGKLKVDARPFDLASQVDHVVRLFEPRAAEKGLRLEARWDPRPPPRLVGDPLRLQQVLSNLVGNALKFTTLGAIELRTHVATQGDRCAVSLDVVDTGPGITPEVLARLFRPWEQDDRAARVYGGTGLGLVISRQLVEAMGGQLNAISELGKGTTFRLTLELPLAPEEPVAAPALHTPAAVPLAPLSGRVLVVDDNAINQLVAQGVLRQLGLEVEVAGDGAGAQALLSERPFDAVVTDLHMPGVDGLELVRWLRAQDGLLQLLPIVVITADLLPDERAACLDAGANAVLNKPFRAAEVEACLRAQASALTRQAA